MKRREFIALSGAGLLAGCAPTIVTRRVGEDPFEGGIGGTGIVGLMTDFGSVKVNGLTVELDSRTRIFDAFEPSSDSVLQIGAPLSIVAHYSKDRLVARRVDVSYPLVGVLRRDREGYSINGHPVFVEPGAQVDLAVGRRVAASGLWQAKGLTASYIRRVGQGDDLLASVVGPGPDGMPILGRAPIKMGAGQSLPPIGSFATVRGRYDGASFVASQVTAGRFQPLAGGFRQLSVEGFLVPSSSAPGFRIAGLGHSFDQRVNPQALAGARGLYFGRYSGKFNASLGYVLPGNLESRRQVLRDGFDGALQRKRFEL